MAKRKPRTEGESPHRKRQRIARDLERKDEPVRIQTVKDLRQLLAFEQDAGPQVRQSKTPVFSLEDKRAKSKVRGPIFQNIFGDDFLWQG